MRGHDGGGGGAELRLRPRRDVAAQELGERACDLRGGEAELAWSSIWRGGDRR